MGGYIQSLRGEKNPTFDTHLQKSLTSYGVYTSP